MITINRVKKNGKDCYELEKSCNLTQLVEMLPLEAHALAADYPDCIDTLYHNHKFFVREDGLLYMKKTIVSMSSSVETYWFDSSVRRWHKDIDLPPLQ